MVKKQNKSTLDKMNIVISLLSILTIVNLAFVGYIVYKPAAATGDVDYSQVRKVVKEEILANEYEKMWGKDNFEAINALNLPQIEQAVAQYKQKQAQEEADKLPKFLSQDEVKAVLAEGYNQWGENPDYIWLEYSEMECPYCIRFAKSNAKDMVEEAYGDKVAHGFRHYPLSFHPNAVPAALVAECAGAEKGNEGFYWVIEKSFENEKQDLESMISYAKEVGADEAKVRACVKAETYKEKIDAQMKMGAEKFGISGTPGHVLINTKTGQYTKVSGAVWGGTLINAIEKIK